MTCLELISGMLLFMKILIVCPLLERCINNTFLYIIIIMYSKYIQNKRDRYYVTLSIYKYIYREKVSQTVMFLLQT